MSALNSVLKVIRQNCKTTPAKIRVLRRELKPLIDEYSLYLQLGRKEREILQFLWENRSTKHTHDEIAKLLKKRTKTVSNQVTNIRSKFGNAPIRDIAERLKEFY